MLQGNAKVIKESAYKMRSATARAAFFLAISCLSSLVVPANAANGSVTYTYDALGRLSTATYDTGIMVLYNYDANGNRTQQIINVNTANLSWSPIAPCLENCWGTALWAGPQP